jgi:DUF917 family protein
MFIQDLYKVNSPQVLTMKINFLNECLEIQDKDNQVITMPDLQIALEC